MSIRVMTAVFDHSRSRLADRLVLLVIADRSNDDGSGCWRGKESIARKAGVSRATVTRSVLALEELGELVVDRRPGRTSEYRIALPGVGSFCADPSEGTAQAEPTVGSRVSRGSAQRGAAIHPDTSIDPRYPTVKEIRAVYPDEKPDSTLVVETISQARQSVRAGRAKNALP